MGTIELPEASDLIHAEDIQFWRCLRCQRLCTQLEMQRALGPGAESPPDDDYGTLKSKGNGKHK